MHKTILSVSTIFALTLASTGCVATKKHVKSVSDPLDRRIGGLEAKSRETDATLANHEKGISAVDERAKGADARAGDAAKQAATAHERLGELGKETTALGQQTADAKSLANQGLTRTNELEQKVTERMSALDNYQVVTTENVLFGVAVSKLSADAKKQLDNVASQALGQKRYVIEVQGFTDKTGNSAMNLDLSRQRADEVVRYFTLQHKIPLFRISQLGSGSLVQVADNRTREGRQQNRRVEVRVYVADPTDGRKVTASASGGR